MEMIQVEALAPDEHNVRRKVDADKAAFSELVRSIKGVGIVEPLVVRRIEPDTGDHVYRVVAGHRRLAAAIEAGLAEVPCEVREMSDTEAIEFQLVENLMRVDIDPVEEASGYFRLVELGMNKKSLAERIGKSQAHITGRLKLLELDPKVLALVKKGEVSAAKAIGTLGYEGDVLDAAIHAVATGRDVEWAVSRATAEADAERRLAEFHETWADCERHVGGTWQMDRNIHPLAEFDLTEDQLAAHRAEGPHLAWYDPQRDSVIECTTDLKATRKLLGIKASTLSPEEQERRLQARQERARQKAVDEMAGEVLLGRKLPMTAADLDQLARERAMRTFGEETLKRAARILGYVPEKGAEWGWWDTALKVFLDEGVAGYRQVIAACEYASAPNREAMLREWGYELEDDADG